MRGPDHNQSSLFSYTNIEDRIAVDHPLPGLPQLPP